jgi:hypothetical protein
MSLLDCLPELLTLITGYADGIGRIMMSLTCRKLWKTTLLYPQSYFGVYNQSIIEVLQSLGYSEYNITNILVKHGDLDLILSFAKEDRLFFPKLDINFHTTTIDSLIAKSIEYNRVDLLKHFVETKIIPDPSKHFHTIARYGSLDCLKYLREIGCVWDEEILNGAGMSGSIEMLEYIRNNGMQ